MSLQNAKLLKHVFDKVGCCYEDQIFEKLEALALDLLAKKLGKIPYMIAHFENK